MTGMKRIVTIQDISCLGKCSLTVALPILSAMGVETCVVPTAVLSTHTMFSGYTFRDLTEDLPPIAEHWEREGFAFDAVYTGYLGSARQIDVVSSFIDDFSTPDNLIFIDPAMGDLGRLYTGFDEAFARKMASLCAKGDVIVPNLTEAAFMLGIPYRDSGYDEAYVRELLLGLLDLGASCAVLTGVSFEPDSIGVASMRRGSDNLFTYFGKRIPAQYHGTGDVFASCCVGALTRGASLEDALTLAADFTAESIRLTVADKNAPWYGVNFEQALGWLIGRCSG